MLEHKKLCAHTRGIVSRLIRVSILATLTIIISSSVAAQKKSPLPTETLKEGPQLVVQLGHSGSINAAAFSRDGRFVLSGGDESLAILWETATGREIRRFVGHDGPVNSVAFSPDGRFILTGSGDATARLWNTTTGEETSRFVGHSGSVTAAVFSPDGRSILTGGEDETVRLWSTVTKREIRRFVGHAEAISGIAFSPDGRLALTGSGDVSARLWNVTTGREIHRLAGNSASVAFSPDGRLVLTGESRLVSNVDERKESLVRLWDISTGREIRRFAGLSPVAFSPNGQQILVGGAGKNKAGAQLSEIRTGKELSYFGGDKDELGSDGDTGVVQDIAFSPDGGSVLIVRTSIPLGAGGYLHGGSVSMRLHDLPSGEVIRDFEGYSAPIYDVAFSGDGRFALSGEHLWNLVTGKKIQFDGLAEDRLRDSQSIRNVMISKDGRLAVSADSSETAIAQLWDAATGMEVQRFETGGIDTAWILPDSRFVLTESRLFSEKAFNIVRLWAVSTGKELWHYEIKSGDYAMVELHRLSKDNLNVALSPDGRFVLVQENGESLALLDTATGIAVQHFRVPFKGIPLLAFTPDGRSFAVVNDTDTVGLWNVGTGAQVRSFKTNFQNMVESMVFSPNGEFLAIGGNGERGGVLESAVQVWSDKTGQKIQQFERQKDSTHDIRFSWDSRFILTTSADNTVHMWSLATGKEVQRFVGSIAAVGDLAFSPDDRFVLTGSADGIARLWRSSTGEELCRMISLRNGNWVVVSPDGRFDTNNLEEIKGLQWVFSDEPMRPLPLEIYMRDYYEPRLLPSLLNGKALEQIKPLGSLNRVQPVVKITKIEQRKLDPESDLMVTIDVANTSGEQLRDGKRITLQSAVFDLRLFRDGQLVGYVPGDLKLDNNGKATVVLPVKLRRDRPSEKVEFTAYAFNADRVKSVAAAYTYEPRQSHPPMKGRAYVISVGVNAYEDQSLDLSFAANDAQLSEQMLTRKLSATGLYSEVIPISLASDHSKGPNDRTVTEKLATKQNFRVLLDALAHGLAKADPDAIRRIPGADKLRKVEPEDLVLISFSSHGYTDRQGKFYLIPYDTGSSVEFLPAGDDIAPSSLSHFISSDELSQWFREIDAGELVMIVDTCHSAGAVDEPGFKPGPMGSRGMGQLAYDKGMRILAASQADDVALELDRLQHGLLTYALMAEGLEQKRADQNGDGRITLDEWLGYGAERVPTLYEDVKAGRLAELKSKDVHITSMLSGASVKKNAFQQPQLFDFKRKRREVILQ